jgi:hypothetical protein
MHGHSVRSPSNPLLLERKEIVFSLDLFLTHLAALPGMTARALLLVTRKELFMSSMRFL